MVLARSQAIPGSQQSADKKQKSISSFFSAKPAQPVKPKTTQNAPSEPKSVSTLNVVEDHSDELFMSEDEAPTNGRRRSSQGTKRALSESKDPDEDDGLPDTKKLRRVAEEHEDDAISGVEESRDLPSGLNQPAKKLKATERTSKYMFSSSPVVLNQEEGTPWKLERMRDSGYGFQGGLEV